MSPRIRDDVESVFGVFDYDGVVDVPAFFVEAGWRGWMSRVKTK